jgi:pSer/pThr/pTyr-binding forkhead associated (FHA) protein
MATLRCPRCGQDNDATFAFCQSCGQSLRAPPRVCAGCQNPLLPGARFCGICGRPVEGAAPPAPAPLTPPPRPVSPAPPTPLRSTPGGGPGPQGNLEVREAKVLRLVAVRHDGLPGPTYVVTRAALNCGRAQGEVLFADDATVSPRHCRFVTRDEGVFVEDLGSVNGTFMRLRQPRALAPGDEFRIGRQLLRLEPIPRPPSADGAVRPWGSVDPGYRARLTQLLEGGGAGEVFPLRLGENALGREVGQVCFPGDRYVSARHARIDVSDGGVLLTDVGSSNGTFVRVGGPTRISSGDQVLIGMQLLRVEG